MTNKEAIGLLKIERVRITPTVFTVIIEAIDMAIFALEAQELSNNSPKLDKENGDLQPTCNQLATDCISRQAAIDAINKALDRETLVNSFVRKVAVDAVKVLPPVQDKYEYHYDHTDCIWYRPEARNRCPSTCAQYRDGWNDAMNYIFRDGDGYRPFRRDKKYEE